jgi:hypothetical protein
MSARKHKKQRSSHRRHAELERRVAAAPVAGCAEARLLRMLSNVLCHSMNSNCTVAQLEKRDWRMRVQFCFIAVMYLKRRSSSQRETNERTRQLPTQQRARRTG